MPYGDRGRDLMRTFGKGRGYTSLAGASNFGMSPEQFRQQAATVTEDELRDLGLPLGPRRLSNEPFSYATGVDPDAMAFEALKKVSLARSQPGNANLQQQAAEAKDRADFTKVGYDEVLRRRQAGFNEAAQTAKPAPWTPLTGTAPDPRITAQTGAAVASQARAGQPQLRMPEPIRAMSLGEHAQLNPWAFSQAMRGLHGARG